MGQEFLLDIHANLLEFVVTKISLRQFSAS